MAVDKLTFGGLSSACIPPLHDGASRSSARGSENCYARAALDVQLRRLLDYVVQYTILRYMNSSPGKLT